MAAQEYFNSFQTGNFSPLPAHPAPAGYPPQQQQQQQQQQRPQQQGPPRPVSQVPSHPPPPYSPSPVANSPAPPQQQSQKPPYFPAPPTPAPAPQQYPVRPPQHSAYLNPDGSPLAPSRSYSSPPDRSGRNYHRSHSRSRSRSSSRSRSRSRHRHHHHGSHSHSHSRDRRISPDNRDRSRQGRRDKVPHRDMDTFLGAGGGAIIGDAIFPGLGTVGGLLLGGYGGRKYAEKKEQRARSERSGSHGSSGYRDAREFRETARGEGHYDYRSALNDGYGSERRSKSSVGGYRYKQ